VRLYDMCEVVRSKNAGPFKTTFDLFFQSEAYYDAVKEWGGLDREAVARAFSIDPERVTTVAYLDGVRVLKVTIVNDSASGDPGNRDVYGAQQGVPLFDLDVPV
jgi:hypothetical protein